MWVTSSEGLLIVTQHDKKHPVEREGERIELFYSHPNLKVTNLVLG